MRTNVSPSDLPSIDMEIGQSLELPHSHLGHPVIPLGMHRMHHPSALICHRLTDCLDRFFRFLFLVPSLKFMQLYDGDSAPARLATNQFTLTKSRGRPRCFHLGCHSPTLDLGRVTSMANGGEKNRETEKQFQIFHSRHLSGTASPAIECL